MLKFYLPVPKNMTFCGYRVLTEVIKLKYPYRKGKFGHRDGHAQREDDVNKYRENTLSRQRVEVMYLQVKEHQMWSINQ